MFNATVRDCSGNPSEKIGVESAARKGTAKKNTFKQNSFTQLLICYAQQSIDRASRDTPE